MNRILGRAQPVGPGPGARIGTIIRSVPKPPAVTAVPSPAPPMAATAPATSLPAPAVESVPDRQATVAPDNRSVLGAGPAVVSSARSVDWMTARTYPIPPREGAVPGWPLEPQPPLSLPRPIVEP